MKNQSQDIASSPAQSDNREVVLRVENLSKTYRLGQIGTGTISHDLNRWWAKVRGKEDPFATVSVANDRAQKEGTNEYVKVLDDITFEVKKGEVLGIIGKNGAGKSTLLKVISKITSPTTGSVKAKGRIASLLEVGTGMHPEMTGKENVYLNGTILGMTRKEIDAKFDEIMDFAGCAKYADTPVKRYSSGMKVRLGFAVAAFLEPEILIVDEVLAVGDADFQDRAIGKMKEISAGGARSVLFVSHNIDSIERLCTRTIVLDKGEIAFEGEVKRGVTKYLESSSKLNQERVFDKKSLNSIQEGVHKGEDSFIDVKGLSFLTGLNEPKREFLSSESIEIQFQFQIKNPKHDFRLVVAIEDSKARTLFITLLSDKDLSLNKLDVGMYTAICTLPKNTFATGTYYLTVHFTDLKQEHIKYSRVVSFDVKYDTVNYRLEGFETSAPLRPLCNWELNKI